jgi:hypothetical protein
MFEWELLGDVVSLITYNANHGYRNKIHNGIILARLISHALLETYFRTVDEIHDGIPWFCAARRCGGNSQRLHAAGVAREGILIARTLRARCHRIPSKHDRLILFVSLLVLPLPVRTNSIDVCFPIRSGRLVASQP